MKDNPLRDTKLIETLLELRKKDNDAFMNLIVETIKSNPDIAIDDDSDPDFKIKALETLLTWLESREEYEDCALMADIKKKIADGKKE